MNPAKSIDGARLFRSIMQLRDIDRQLSGKAGLAVDEMHCLAIIFLERPSCVKHLSGLLDTNATRTSKILSSLENRHLVTPSLDPLDHRKEHVNLTETGFQVAEKILTMYHTIASHIRDGWPFELNSVTEILVKDM